MPSSYTTRLKLEKQATGENSNTWGTRLNDSFVDLIDEAVGGVTTIAFGTTVGDCTIVNNNGATAQGRSAVLVLTGAPASNVALNVPANEKAYLVRSKHTGSNWIKIRPVGAVAGAEVTLATLDTALIYTDGTKAFKVAEKTQASQITAAMLPFVQATTTAAARAFLSVAEIATKAQVTAGTAGNYAPTTQQTGIAILHGFKKYTDSSGAADTIAITCNPVPVSYSEIESVYVKVANTNTSTTVNLNCNALGNIRVKVSGSAGREDPVAGQLRSGVYYEFMYDATNNIFLCLNPTAILNDGYIQGLTLARASTTTYTVATGICRNENSGVKENFNFSTAFTKSLSAWSAGTGNGSLDTGAVATSTWYHIHVIRKDSDGSLDVLMSTSVAAPTMPAGYTARRRIGSILTNSSSQITAFQQVGDLFTLESPVINYSGSPGVTTAVSRTTTTPLGIRVIGELLCILQELAGNVTDYGLITSLDLTDNAPTSSKCNLICGVTGTGAVAPYFFTSLSILTNTSSQVRTRVSSSSANCTLSVATVGWTDPRGAY